MKNVLGLIMAFDNPEELQGLGEFRTAAALPFGCRYRAVDFMLSSMVNAGITTVGLVLKDKYQSLLDHIGTGRDWDLSRKLGGLVFLPPFSYARRDSFVKPGGMLQGRMEALAGIRDYLARDRSEYVVLADGDIIANLALERVMDFHLRTGADVTAVCAPRVMESVYNTYYAVDGAGRVTDYNLGLHADDACRNTSLGIYLMRREILLHLVDEALTHNWKHFERDTLPYLLREYRLNAYIFGGFSAKMQDVKGFFEANMAILDKKIRDELFSRSRPIFTRVRNEEPTYYGDHADVDNCLLADGCTIEGAVRDSIIFRNVRIGKDAVVQNSILLKDAVVRAGSEVSYVIADKEVIVRENRTLIGHEAYPVVIEKRSII